MKLADYRLECLCGDVSRAQRWGVMSAFKRDMAGEVLSYNDRMFSFEVFELGRCGQNGVVSWVCAFSGSRVFRYICRSTVVRRQFHVSMSRKGFKTVGKLGRGCCSIGFGWLIWVG